MVCEASADEAVRVVTRDGSLLSYSHDLWRFAILESLWNSVASRREVDDRIGMDTAGIPESGIRRIGRYGVRMLLQDQRRRYSGRSGRKKTVLPNTSGQPGYALQVECGNR